MPLTNPVTATDQSDRILTKDETIAANRSAVIAGPLSINDGVTLYIADNAVVALT